MRRVTILATVVGLISGCTETTKTTPEPDKASPNDAAVIGKERPEQARARRTRAEEFTFGDVLSHAINEGISIPEDTRYRVPIDGLLAGLPADSVPPQLKLDDQFGWARLNRSVNRRMPRAVELEVEIEDIKFNPDPDDDDRYEPTVTLGPNNGYGYCGSYKGMPCNIRLFIQYESSRGLEVRFRSLSEQDASRLAKLKGKRVRLQLDATRIEFIPRDELISNNPPTRNFAPDLNVTVLHAELKLPQGTLASGGPDTGGYRIKCEVCDRVFTSQKPIPFVPEGDIFNGLNHEHMTCPRCNSQGPFVQIGSPSLSDLLDTPEGQEHLRDAEELLGRSRKQFRPGEGPNVPPVQ